jgi:hypothetical protein
VHCHRLTSDQAAAGLKVMGYGYRATLLPDVCWVYQDAMAAGKLLQSQIHLGESARAFLKALTNQAINDLIDRATGFDRLKTQQSIAEILEKFVAKILQPYVKTFPAAYYGHIYRLNNWDYDIKHFKEVLAIMRGARNWAEFYEMLDRSLPRFNETLQLPFYDTQAMERLPVQPANVFD